MPFMSSQSSQLKRTSSIKSKNVEEFRSTHQFLPAFLLNLALQFFQNQPTTDSSGGGKRHNVKQWEVDMSSNATITHTGYDNRRYHVKTSEMPLFLYKLARSSNTFVNEILPSKALFRFFLDIDITLKRDLPFSEIKDLGKQLAQTAQYVIDKFYSDNNNLDKGIVVLAKPSRSKTMLPPSFSDKDVKSKEDVLFKIGFHLIAHSLIVTYEEMIWLFASFREECRTRFHQMAESKTDWDDWCDEQVYTKSKINLCMAGQLKKEECHNCHGRTCVPPKRLINGKLVQPKCESGRITEDCSYEAVAYCSGGGKGADDEKAVLNWLRKDLANTLVATSLRSPITIEWTEKSTGFQIFHDAVLPKCKEKNNEENVSRNGDFKLIDRTSSTRANRLYELTAKQIHELDEEWKAITVKQISIGKGRLIVFTSGKGSKACLNKGIIKEIDGKRGSHTQRTIYFVMTPTQMQQKCSVKKENKSKYPILPISCHKFASDPFPVNNSDLSREISFFLGIDTPLESAARESLKETILNQFDKYYLDLQITSKLTVDSTKGPNWKSEKDKEALNQKDKLKKAINSFNQYFSFYEQTLLPVNEDIRAEMSDLSVKRRRKKNKKAELKGATVDSRKRKVVAEEDEGEGERGLAAAKRKKRSTPKVKLVRARESSSNDYESDV